MAFEVNKKFFMIITNEEMSSNIEILSNESEILQSPAFLPEKVIDTLDSGDTFDAAALYYLNKSKVEFMPKYKEEATRTNDINQTKAVLSDNCNEAKSDIKKNLGTRRLEGKFTDEPVLEQVIKFVRRIVGAKVDLRGYDCLDIISNGILRSNILEH